MTGDRGHGEGRSSTARRELDDLLEVEECVRYYPPDLAAIEDPGEVFAPHDGVLAERPFDIFVDVPFCPSICGFCPFNVYTFDEGLVRTYLDAIRQEIAAIRDRHDFARISARTLWIGGGTPSVMGIEALDELLTMLRESFDLDLLEELTVEVKPTPSDLTTEKLELLWLHGVRRISMGVQSTQEGYLRLLGRGHTGDAALEMVRTIQDAGFRLNIDMMYRLPGQTVDEVRADVDAVSSLGISHLSYFPYVPHEGTLLATRIARGSVSQQVERDGYQEMFSLVAERLAVAGYHQYTPYHFGGPDPCWYHVGRWGMPQRDTLGLGPGAFSFFNGWIYANEHNPERYAEAAASGRPPIMQAKRLSPIERTTRLAVLGIKLFELDAATFREASGEDLFACYAEELRHLKDAGLITVHADRVTCTAAGRAFNNDIASLLSTDAARTVPHPQAVGLMRT